ncbi:hypothetical protein QLQ12_10130 [Actinoplanes sp. NEAU-A12]|uniref:Uncharacterized protein n=1 Tax=Actinoplanes sandaracinus TaxID=3045177 RepID=A0ABT6WGU9_9ACTN|nr:hypothetical protein [Actinoplanes sandaracinus]MDI6098957.1 hypothetical protein [Actinoplanes sandaracinus]
MAAGTTLARLADEFVAAMREHGLHIDRPAVEQEMRERIAAIADRLRLDPQTVLRDHVRDGWGRQMSAAVIQQIHGERLLDADMPPGASPTAR